MTKLQGAEHGKKGRGLEYLYLSVHDEDRDGEWAGIWVAFHLLPGNVGRRSGRTKAVMHELCVFSRTSRLFLCLQTPEWDWLPLLWPAPAEEERLKRRV